MVECTQILRENLDLMVGWRQRKGFVFLVVVGLRSVGILYKEEGENHIAREFVRHLSNHSFMTLIYH